MPALTALDECLATIANIASYAEQGLTDRIDQHVTLLAIHRSCIEVYETVRGIAAHLPDEDPHIKGTLLN